MVSFQHFYEMVEAYRKKNKLDEIVPFYESRIIPCRKCGSTNEIEFEYCINCGSNISKICPKCGQSYNLELNFCGKCGMAIPDAAHGQ